MTWLWTDTLAALLVEHDRVAPERVSRWIRRPIAVRLPDGVGPLDLARSVLLDQPSPSASSADEA